MLKILSVALFTAFLSSFTTFKPANWEDVYSDSKISIQSQTQGCNDVHNGVNKEHVFLKLINKTDKIINVTYSLELHYNNKCYTCNNLQEYTYTQTINPGEEISGNCDNLEGLSIFSKMLDAASNSKLTNYVIKNIVVNE